MLTLHDNKGDQEGAQESLTMPFPTSPSLFLHLPFSVALDVSMTELLF